MEYWFYMEAEKIYKKGTFWERLLALIIDEIILFVITVIFSLFLSQIADNLTNLIFWVLSIAYGTFFIWKSGSTPGKKLLKIKVVNSSYQPLGLGASLLRESIGKLLSGIIFNLGYLWVLINGKRQAWHDKLAKSFVVKMDSTGALVPVETEEKVTTGQKVTFTLMFLIFGLPIPAATIFLIVYLFIAQPSQISGQAMAPNYVNGQYYLANKLTYRSAEPARGDVVVFKAPKDQDKDFIKRIIGLPGESVSIQNGKVYVNNQPLDETSYIKGDIQTVGGSFLQEGQEVTVSANQYFVLGDNRPFSSDSREWGFVPKENIISKISLCYYKCELSNK